MRVLSLSKHRERPFDDLTCLFGPSTGSGTAEGGGSGTAEGGGSGSVEGIGAVAGREEKHRSLWFFERFDVPLQPKYKNDGNRECDIQEK